MTKEETYLLTAFACSACDGEIAKEEVELIKNWASSTDLFQFIDIETKLNDYVDAINKNGIVFLNQFLDFVSSSDLSKDEQLKIVDVAIKMIEADNQILYYEVKFFKRLRACLTISDSEILEVFPDIEDFLQPDIKTSNFDFSLESNFEQIDFSSLESK